MPAPTPPRRGLAIIYLMVVVTVLAGFISFAVDYGRVQLVKTELLAAADAAAPYAARGIENGTYLSKAIDAANDNSADGSPVVLTAADVRLGNWDETLVPKFSTARTPTNAVEITARRAVARGNPVPLLFASLLGFRSCDVHAVSIAMIEPGIVSGFIGLHGFAVKNNLFSASYDSSVNPNPSQTNYRLKGMLGSNTSITAKNNETVGQVVLGPDGTTNLSLTAPPIVLKEPIPAPASDFSEAPAVNPAGTPKNLNVSGTMSLPGGSYTFTSITLGNNAKLTFLGPATVYIDGNVTFSQNGEIAAYQNIPASLKIRQRGAGTNFGGPNANSVNLIADIEAPQTAFAAKNNATIQGRAIFDSINVKNNAEFYYDESLHTTINEIDQGQAVSLVQ